MKILVTGDAGFIAGFLIPALIDAHHQITGIDLLSNHQNSDGYDHFVGDVTDKNTVFKVTKGLDCIVHLAAVHADEGPEDADYYHTNSFGTKVLLEAARKYNINKFIFFSTVGVYGDTSPADENTHTNPINAYGSSKLEAEEAITEWCYEDKNRKAIIVRPTAVYGPKNKANIFRLIKQVSENKFLMIGNGRNKKALVYVKNVVSAVMYLINNFDAKLNVYNLVDYPTKTTYDLVNTITQINRRELSKFRIPLTIAIIIICPINGILKLFGQKPLISIKRIKKFCADTEYIADKIRQTGYKQEISTIDGLSETIKWNKKHNW